MAQDPNDETTRGVQRKKPAAIQLADGHNYLLAIGIDNYQNCPKLFNAAKDAKDVVAVLEDKYQFDPAHTFTMFDQDATQGNIYKMLDKLAKTVTNQDNLVIYFSGHGEYNETIEEGFWIPVNGDLNNIVGTCLPFDIFSKYLKAIPSFHTFVIADSCYAGSMFRDRNLAGVAPSLQRMYGIPSRWLLTAGRNEVVSDGKQGQNSPFADSLLFHLRNNRQAALRVSELCQLVIQDVASNAAQIPRGEPIHGVGHRGGEFLFLGKDVKNFNADIDEKAVADLFGPTRGIGSETVAEPPPRSSSPMEPPAVREPERFASLDAIRETLEAHLIAGDLEAVFKLFNRVLQTDASMKNELILTQSQYNSLQREVRQGIATSESARITTNRIRAALQYYVERLEDEDIKAEVMDGANPPAPGASGTLSDLEREGLEKEAAILQRKVNFFREELAKTSDVNQKFTVQEQIDGAEKRLAEIRQKLA